MRQDYSLYRRSGSKVWYFYYYDGDIRKSRTTGTTKKYEAVQFALAFVKRNNRDDITFSEFAGDFFDPERCSWLKRQEARGNPMSKPMQRMRRAHMVNYLLPAFGTMRLSKITAVDIEKAIFPLDLAAGTKRHIMNTLRTVLREAERAGYIPFNPVLKVDPIRKDGKAPDAFTQDELRRLFPTDDTALLKVWGNRKYATAFLVLATTGMRSGELRALKWHHIHWNQGIVIDQAVKADDTIGLTKTGRPRVVPLLRRAEVNLQALLSKTRYGGEDSFVFPSMYGDHPLKKRTLLMALR